MERQGSKKCDRLSEDRNEETRFCHGEARKHGGMEAWRHGNKGDVNKEARGKTRKRQGKSDLQYLRP